jgi:hypothetical protein
MGRANQERQQHPRCKWRAGGSPEIPGLHACWCRSGATAAPQEPTALTAQYLPAAHGSPLSLTRFVSLSGTSPQRYHQSMSGCDKRIKRMCLTIVVDPSHEAVKISARKRITTRRGRSYVQAGQISGNPLGSRAGANGSGLTCLGPCSTGYGACSEHLFLSRSRANAQCERQPEQKLP